METISADSTDPICSVLARPVSGESISNSIWRFGIGAKAERFLVEQLFDYSSFKEFLRQTIRLAPANHSRMVSKPRSYRDARIAFVHGRPGPHPTHTALAKAINAEFMFVDRILRYHDLEDTGKVRR